VIDIITILYSGRYQRTIIDPIIVCPQHLRLAGEPLCLDGAALGAPGGQDVLKTLHLRRIGERWPAGDRLDRL